MGPSMTDAQWQSHTKELRERYEEARRTNEHVLINEFCREYAEGRVTTAAMRSVVWQCPRAVPLTVRGRQALVEPELRRDRRRAPHALRFGGRDRVRRPPHAWQESKSRGYRGHGARRTQTPGTRILPEVMGLHAPFVHN